MNTDNTATLPASTMDTAREISRASDHGQDDKAALRLWLRLLPLTTLVEQELRSRLRQRFGITLPQFDVLAELDRLAEPQTMTELSRPLMVSTGNLTGVVDRLERAGAITWARACPLFVPIVEEGVSDTAIARLVASHYLEGRPPLDAVILGCTPYPALKGVLAEVLGEGVTLIDSAEAVAAVVARDLRRLGLLAPAGGRAGVRYLVTGDVPSFLHAAEVLGGPAGTYEQLPVTDLSLGPAERAR